MSAFDDLTLGEVEEMQEKVLGGKPIQDSDPLLVAGAVMWMTARRTGELADWDTFKKQVTMGEIKNFSQTQMGDPDPLGSQS